MALTFQIIEQRQVSWGYEVRAKVWDDQDAQVEHQWVYRHWPASEGVPSQATINTEIQRRVDQLEQEMTQTEADELKEQNIGPDFVQEVMADLRWAVVYIRDNPTVTYAQFAAAWEFERPNSLFSVQQYTNFINNRLLGGITWQQFKNYCINRIFEGID